MARYEITSPQGERYEVTAPDSATQAEVLAYAKQKFSTPGGPAKPPARPAYDAALASARTEDVGRRKRDEGHIFGGGFQAMSQALPLPLGDEMRGGGAALVNTVKNIGRRSRGEPVVPSGDIYDAYSTAEKEYEGETKRRHPTAVGTGETLTSLGGAKVAQVGMQGLKLLPEALKSGGVTGLLTGLHGLAEGEGWQDRLEKGGTEGAGGFLGGFGLHYGLGGANNFLARGADPDLPGNILRENGIASTALSRLGKVTKGFEDLGKRVPILGQAMVGFQERQIDQFNRAVGLNALTHIGEPLPKSMKPGAGMVEHVEQKIGDAYDAALSAAPTYTFDTQLLRDGQDVIRRAGSLAKAEREHLADIVQDKFSRLAGANTSVEAKKIFSELGTLQRELAGKGNTTMASLVGDLKRATLGPVERAYPEAAKLIKKADKAYSIYVPMNRASAAASNQGGRFLPSQFGTAAKQSAKEMGPRMAGKGKAPLYRLTEAAQKIIPDSYGNPGTANALSMMGGASAVATPIITGKPELAIPAAGMAAGLTAAATPYLLKGRKLIENLSEAAGPNALQSAALKLRQYAAKDPRVAPLYRQVMAQIQRATREPQEPQQAR